MNENIIKLKIKNKVKIIETDTRKYVLKKKTKDLNELFEYLNSRSFDKYPKIIEQDREDIKYEFLASSFIPKEEKGKELIETLAILHFKTTYYKTVSRKKYKEIYTSIIDNIDYLKDYYNKLITNIEKEVYMSPSSYLIARNYSIIQGAITYCEKELNRWYKIVEKKDKERVSVVHNNITTDHFIHGESGYLINWDHYIIDTPILDIYKFYKKEYNKYDFKELLKTYNKTVKLSTEEQKLLFILLSLPSKIEKIDNELENTKNIKSIIDYMGLTNNLVFSGVFNIEGD